MSLRKELLGNFNCGSLFSYVRCGIDVPENFLDAFAKFPPIFKNNNKSRGDFGPFLKKYAEKEGLLTQPGRMLISSYFLENGTMNRPFLFFYLDLRLIWKDCRLVQYTPMKPMECLSNFFQSAVIARREGDENPNSSVVAQTMKLLPNSSYGYEVMDRSQHTVTNYPNDE